MLSHTIHNAVATHNSFSDCTKRSFDITSLKLISLDSGFPLFLLQSLKDYTASRVGLLEKVLALVRPLEEGKEG